MNISVANSTADYFDVNIFWASVSAEKKKRNMFDCGRNSDKISGIYVSKIREKRIKAWV